MLVNVQSYRIEEFSAIDINTIQANFKLATESQYQLLNGGRTLKKVGGVAGDSRMCEVTGKPRPGKFFMRVKFNGTGNYSTIAVSTGLITPNNQVAWTSGSLAGNVWHEVRIEHVSGETYKYTVNGSPLYQGTAKNLTFYGHSSVTEIAFDTGQEGAALPAGFAWY